MGKGKGKGKVSAVQGFPPPRPEAQKSPAPDAEAARSQSAEPTMSWGRRRRLHWREVSSGEAVAAGSIFEGCEAGSGSADFDWNEWDSLFAPQEPDLQKEPKPKLSPRRTSSPAPTEICVLSRRQATCCGVVLSRTGDLGGLEERLRCLAPVAEEDAARLQELLDHIEDAQAQKLWELAHTAEPPIELRDVERRLLPLLGVDRVRHRLRLVRIGGSIASEQERVEGAARAYAEAAASARSSTALKDFMRSALSLRDYALRGPGGTDMHSGPPPVMDIGSLLSGMREFKSVNPGQGQGSKVTLLNFFVRSMLRVNPGFDDELEGELRKVIATQALTWSGLREETAHLAASASFAASEATDHAGAYGSPGSEAPTRLSKLAEDAKAAAASANRAVDEARAVLDDLGRYFGVGAKSQVGGEPSGAMVLRQLVDLVEGFRRACAEVRTSMDVGAAGLSRLPKAAPGSPPRPSPGH